MGAVTGRRARLRPPPWCRLPGERRGGGDCLRCIVNLSGEPVPFPPHATVLLASGPLDSGLLPPDTTAWLRIE